MNRKAGLAETPAEEAALIKRADAFRAKIAPLFADLMAKTAALDAAEHGADYAEKHAMLVTEYLEKRAPIDADHDAETATLVKVSP